MFFLTILSDTLIPWSPGGLSQLPVVIDYRIDCRIDLSLTETQTSIHNSFTIILNSSLTLVITDLVYIIKENMLIIEA